MFGSAHARKRHVYPILAWAVVAILVVAAAFAGLVFVAVKMPFQGYTADSVLLDIAPRTTTIAILESLEKEGVLRDWRLGLVALRLLHPGKTLKAGEYRFSGERTPEQVILAIVAGDVVTYRITVPEGFSSEEVFSLFTSQGFGFPADYRYLDAHPAELEGVPAGAPSLEGFLFPETYTVTRSMSAREIVVTMTRAFARHVPAAFDEDARRVGLTLVGAVTLASLIEKETAIPDERPLVSAVYHNRMKHRMLLQADPTTIYALKRLGQWRGVLARSQLLVDDPYNTYVTPGLPPGPICNPGLASLSAAVHPAPEAYLFFVSAGDGSHQFSSTFDEHGKNVTRYLRSRRAQRESARTQR
ncbi:MAG: endolytic transglycosylase MltG [Thermoanaerobaculia bacterium]